MLVLVLRAQSCGLEGKDKPDKRIWVGFVGWNADLLTHYHFVHLKCRYICWGYVDSLQKWGFVESDPNKFYFCLFTTIGTVELDLNYCCLHEHFHSMCTSTLLDLFISEKEMINFMPLVLPQEFSVWIIHCLWMSSNTFYADFHRSCSLIHLNLLCLPFSTQYKPANHLIPHRLRVEKAWLQSVFSLQSWLPMGIWSIVMGKCSTEKCYVQLVFLFRKGVGLASSSYWRS